MKLSRKFLITFAVISIVQFALVFFAIQYTGYVDRKRDALEERRIQQLCGVFGGINKQYQANPPQNESAKAFAEDIRKLVESLNCPSE